MEIFEKIGGHENPAQTTFVKAYEIPAIFA